MAASAIDSIKSFCSCVELGLLFNSSRFFSALSNLSRDRALEDKHQLESALARAAVACYAAEGVYPPNIQYLEENYGVQINKELYTVKYEVIASNLMPDITVLENFVHE